MSGTDGVCKACDRGWHGDCVGILYGMACECIEHRTRPLVQSYEPPAMLNTKTLVPHDSGSGTVYAEARTCEEIGVEHIYVTWRYSSHQCCTGSRTSRCLRCHEFRCLECGSAWRTWQSRKIETVDTGGLT